MRVFLDKIRQIFRLGEIKNEVKMPPIRLHILSSSGILNANKELEALSEVANDFIEASSLANELGILRNCDEVNTNGLLGQINRVDNDFLKPSSLGIVFSALNQVCESVDFAPTGLANEIGNSSGTYEANANVLLGQMRGNFLETILTSFVDFLLKVCSLFSPPIPVGIPRSHQDVVFTYQQIIGRSQDRKLRRGKIVLPADTPLQEDSFLDFIIMLKNAIRIIETMLLNILREIGDWLNNQLFQKIGKTYFPRLIGKGVAGHIPYQTWPRPPTGSAFIVFVSRILERLTGSGVGFSTNLEVSNG